MNAKTRAITSLPTCGSQAGLYRDSFLPKVTGFCPDTASVNTYLLYCRPLAAKRLTDNVFQHFQNHLNTSYGKIS
jgi:hypothetical protein